ncbi:hypothetical protein M8C13_08555 [Crossiella sp. SN42]|uniref:hypothetical protein n=1 Tax=Crossiella sp. SN42 TaxID=2944808 RepID=UPI00207CEAAE|nr:hypothetical protein [Crossiella sp. SN42]MCO1575805.1 hypothetical protein [Crossiella sp. SN42]
MAGRWGWLLAVAVGAAAIGGCVKWAADGELRWLTMVVAGKPGGGCQVIAPDGIAYPDLVALAEDSALASPARYLGGGIVLALLLATAIVAIRLRRSGEDPIAPPR